MAMFRKSFKATFKHSTRAMELLPLKLRINKTWPKWNLIRIKRGHVITQLIWNPVQIKSDPDEARSMYISYQVELGWWSRPMQKSVYLKFGQNEWNSVQIEMWLDNTKLWWKSVPMERELESTRSRYRLEIKLSPCKSHSTWNLV